MAWTAEATWNDLSLQDGQWKSPSSLETHGYVIGVEAKSGVDHSGNAQLTAFRVVAEPSESGRGYSLLVDYNLTISDDDLNELISMDVEKDLFSSIYASQSASEVMWSRSVPTDRLDGCSATLRLRVVQMLSGSRENLSDESPYRDFALLNGNTAYFVDVNYLADLGGAQFAEWKDLRSKGHRRTVVMDWAPDDLRLLMDALCTYRSPVITCRNYDFILSVASRLKITKVLRAIERFLIDARHIHPIRKLELAVEFRLAMLGDAILRSFRSPLDALDSLHDFLNQNGETLDNVHPDVLLALDVHLDYVIV
uniref:Uncharacterized protein n=1 Tax=Plectus sambesii TaxID=2011161 RepID=A0A914WSM5_9BILA